MKKQLKELLKQNVTDTGINKIKGLSILAMTCFWRKCNFSAIVKYYEQKLYCYYDNTINDFVIENA